jgi:mRNA degradation ribonuclease J1/J2
MALAARGVVHVTVPVDATGHLAGEIRMVSRGVLDEARDAHLTAAARNEAAEAARALAATGPMPEETAIVDAVRSAVRRTFARELGFKPVTLVTVLWETP